MTTTTICNGKYRIENNNGILTVYRHGELWRQKDLIGDGFVLGLVQKLEACDERINTLLGKINGLESKIDETRMNGNF